MIKQFIILFFSIFYLSSCNTKTSSDSKNSSPISPERQFRSINWDMTREEVIANETAKRMQADGKLIETDSLTLWYKPINLFGSDFTLQYEFDSSKLKERLKRNLISVSELFLADYCFNYFSPGIW